MLIIIRNLLITTILICIETTGISQNAIVSENALPGNPASEWDISRAGDLSIQGFATAMSVNKGSPISFKITTVAGIRFGIKIYRLGYYQGNGARLVADLGNTFTGVSQAPCITNTTTGEIDCGNWVSQSTWNVPATAVSGIYIARIRRNDNGGASHIIFVVRDDAGNSPILFKTADATWQAYNDYGGNNFYGGTVPGFTLGRAVKLSYNRPFYNRKGVIPNTAIAGLTGLFNAEYAMVRWMERNGYDMSYTTCVDMARDPSLIIPSGHRILLSVGHDEYWSAEERNKFESAANAGVSLAFFSGNEVYWKTRWENSIDGSGTPYRTLVCYKDGDGERGCGGRCDPVPNMWTGLWRFGCDFPGTDGCNPENKLTGQISWAGTTNSIIVPSEYRNFRFWKNTKIANLSAGQSVIMPYGTLGHEWDPETPAYELFYPPQRITLSNTLDGGQVHKLSMYKHNSGALVFSAGTVQWSWGLDAGHDRGNLPPSPDMQQATVNLLGDMGVLPATLQAALVAPSPSVDKTPPVTIINLPVTGAGILVNSVTSISGTASDPGGAVGGVEISFDNGITWKAAVGADTWSYSWIPAVTGSITFKVRAFDDSWNVPAKGNETLLTVNVIAPPTTGICATSDSVSDFSLGTTGTNISIVREGNGSLILKPTENQDFESSSAPPGWSVGSWSGTNTPQFSGGVTRINGSRLYSNTSFLPGNSIEFLARFSDDSFENIGFSGDGNFNNPWVMIGRDGIAAKGTLYARTSLGSRVILGTNLTGQYHRYKIKWNTNNFEFYVDGKWITNINETMAKGIILMSDFNANGLDLSVEWIRILPYTSSGTYISKVFDAGASSTWKQIFWNAIQPEVTGIAVAVRTGNTSIPDNTWSNYSSIINGSDINKVSRYIQFTADFSSSDNAVTAELQNILISCNSSIPVTGYNLEQNYPNPFTGQTTIAYSVPGTTNVRLIFYDLQGRKIKVIDEGMRSPGRYLTEVMTDQLARGIYYYMMEADGFRSARKMIIQ